MILRWVENDAALQHILDDKCLTKRLGIFTLLMNAILVFAKIAKKWAVMRFYNLYGAKK